MNSCFSVLIVFSLLLSAHTQNPRWFGEKKVTWKHALCFHPTDDRAEKQTPQVNGLTHGDSLILELGGFNDLTNAFPKSPPLTLNPTDLLVTKPEKAEFLEPYSREVKDDAGSSNPPSTPSSPNVLSPSSHSVTSPESIFSDNCTQLSLIERSEGLNLADDLNTVDSNTFWSMVSDDAACLPDSAARKSLKCSPTDNPSSSTFPTLETSTLMFEAGAAVSSSQFVFSKFGSDVPSIFTFGAPSSNTSTSSVISGGR